MGVGYLNRVHLSSVVLIMVNPEVTVHRIRGNQYGLVSIKVQEEGLNLSETSGGLTFHKDSIGRVQDVTVFLYKVSHHISHFMGVWYLTVPRTHSAVRYLRNVDQVRRLDGEVEVLGGLCDHHGHIVVPYIDTNYYHAY